jgi:hypothetical protein
MAQGSLGDTFEPGIPVDTAKAASSGPAAAGTAASGATGATPVKENKPLTLELSYVPKGVLDDDGGFASDISGLTPVQENKPLTLEGSYVPKGL